MTQTLSARIDQVRQVGLTPFDHPQLEVHGTYQERFEAVRNVFVEHFNTGLDAGAAVSVFIDGQPVVDLWGGFVDPDYTRPWTRNTVVNTFSTTKTMTAFCALVLADRGELDLDAPVAKYWPEFAANGKENIPVRQIVSHTSGLCTWEKTIPTEVLYDWERATSLLAEQAPLFRPGSGWAYHGLTMGHLVGEVVRRITGDTMGTFFAREIAGPLGASFHIGTQPYLDPHVAPIVQAIPHALPDGTGTKSQRGMYNPWFDLNDVNSIPWRRAEIGAANGHGNAYAIAAIQAVLANGGESLGRHIMTEAGCRRVLEVQADNACFVTGTPARMGMGYGLASPVLLPNVTDHEVAFWGGQGGSLSYVDFDLRMSVGYVPNRWIFGRCENDRRIALLRALYGVLGS